MSTRSDDPADTARAGSADGHAFPPPAPSAAAPQPSAAGGSTPWTDAEPDSDPPVADESTPTVPYGTRAGDLTPRWRAVLAAAWIIAFFAYAAIWQASVQIGIATWWIGPRAQPTHMVVRILPSVLTITMAMCVIYNVPRLLRVSAIGVTLATLGAIPDFSRSTGLGAAELLVAGLLGLVTLVALSGRYRLAPAADALDSGGATGIPDAPGSRHSPDSRAPTGPPPFPDTVGSPPMGGTADGTANGPTAGPSSGPSGDDADHRAAMASFAPPEPKGP
jgi:hypothetical protein